MGIDQVMVIPTMMIMHFPFVENADGADAFCEAYNNLVVDWCARRPAASSAPRCCRCRRRLHGGRSSASPTSVSRWGSSARSTRRPSTRTPPRPSMMAARRRTTRSSRRSRRPAWCSACTPSRRPLRRTRWASTTSRRRASCSTAPASTRRRSRSSTRCRSGSRRCCSPASSTATRSSRWPSSSPTPTGSRTCSRLRPALQALRPRARRTTRATGCRRKRSTSSA